MWVKQVGVAVEVPLPVCIRYYIGWEPLIYANAMHDRSRSINKGASINYIDNQAGGGGQPNVNDAT